MGPRIGLRGCGRWHRTSVRTRHRHHPSGLSRGLVGCGGCACCGLCARGAPKGHGQGPRAAWAAERLAHRRRPGKGKRGRASCHCLLPRRPPPNWESSRRMRADGAHWHWRRAHRPGPRRRCSKRRGPCSVFQSRPPPLAAPPPGRSPPPPPPPQTCEDGRGRCATPRPLGSHTGERGAGGGLPRGASTTQGCAGRVRRRPVRWP